MGEESVRDKLRKISDVMDNFSLETMKIAKIQADLCDVKKENTILKEKVDSLEQDTSILKEENTIMKGELGTMKNENTILKDLNKTVLEKVSNLVKENTVLTNSVDLLRNDVHMLKSTFMSKGILFYFLKKSNSNSYFKQKGFSVSFETLIFKIKFFIFLQLGSVVTN